MSMHNITLAFVIASGTATFAQAENPSRTVAQLPASIEDTGELAPAQPPKTSAAASTEVDLSTNQYGIGSPASKEDIAKVDIDIMPDGRGLPEGDGTYAEGADIYAYNCAACHGENLEGIAELGAPKLVGGRGSLPTDQPVKTVESYWPYASTLFDYVYRAMPMNAPGSLSPDEVYAVSAYILGRGGIIPDDPETALDARSLANVTMPNVDGFVADPRGTGKTE